MKIIDHRLEFNSTNHILALSDSRKNEVLEYTLHRQRFCIKVADGHDGTVGEMRGLGPHREAGEPLL